MIDIVNIRSKDLNLLKIFATIWEERNVTRAAEIMGITQSSMSNALSRLRREFNDDLFVRGPAGVIPTPLAQQVAERILSLVSEANAIFGKETSAFDPKTANRTVVIGTTDYFEQIIMVDLLAVLEKEAPGIRLICRPLRFELPKAELEQGHYDLAIAGFFSEVPSGYMKQRILVDKMTCVARKGLIKKKLNLETYLSRKHILISPGGELQGLVDKVLAKEGKKRNVVAGTHSFLSPGALVARTDYLLTAPERLCLFFKEYFDLEVFAPPVKLPPIIVEQVWHQRVNKDPVVVWIRRKIFEICR